MGKNKEPKEGYPTKLFDEQVADKHLCEKCKKVLRVAVQGPCGHRFCQGCAEDLWSSAPGSSVICPVCQSSEEEDPGLLSEDSISPDHAIRRQVAKLKVHCRNFGCSWSGTLKQYETHEEECRYRCIACAECGEEVPLQLLSSHKQNNCRSLSSSFTTLSLPHNVSTDGYEDLLRKVNQLTLQVTPQNATQLLMKIDALEKKMAQMEQSLAAKASASRDPGPRNSFATMTDLDKYKQIFKMVNDKIKQLEIMSNVLNEQISTAVKQMKENDSKMRDVLEKTQQTVTKLSNVDKVLALHDIRLSEVETLGQNMEQFTSFDGVLYWRIDSWSKRQQEAEEDKVPSIYSPPFFTARFGYKMCMRLYPKGDGMGKGSHLSLFFVVMKGPCDNLLPWPFVRKVSMYLLDQTATKDDWMDSFTPDPNSSSFKQPKNEMNIASGCPKFYDLDSLYKKADRYLKDNTMFIKVVVDTKDNPRR